MQILIIGKGATILARFRAQQVVITLSVLTSGGPKQLLISISFNFIIWLRLMTDDTAIRQTESSGLECTRNNFGETLRDLLCT